MKHDRKIIYWAGFLFSVPIGLAAYINSSFLSVFVGEKLAGIVFTVGSIASILAVLVAPKIFRKLGAYKFLVLIAALDALSFWALSFIKNTPAVIIIFILGFSLNTLIVFSLDELLKIFSKDSDTGKIRGVYLTLGNLAWIFAMILSITVLGVFSFTTIYFTGFLIMMLFAVLCFVSLKNIPEPKYDRINMFKYLDEFLLNKNLSRAYVMSFLVQLFYCWMIIYTPIYLSAHLGFAWKEIALIFAIMLLPFTFVPIWAGRYADKIGERKILMFGFILTALSTFSLFFVHEKILWVWALLLFITRIGIATTESMSDTYFFKHIKSENEEFVGVYRSALPVAYVLGPLIAFVAFNFIPNFSYIFILLGMFLLCGVYLASKINKADI